MPLAARWPVRPCDVVLSFSHCVAKAATPPPGVPHVCYCFSPMRYAWHMQASYFGDRPRGPVGRGKEAARAEVLRRLRDWDRATADRVTHFVAISRTVQARIRESYGRDSVVIYPPVDTDFYTPTFQAREDFYLVVSALAPYKRFDLAAAACRALGRRLVVIGTGPDLMRVRAAAGPDAAFLGHQPDAVVRDHLRRCRALLFPGEEDFGIAPVEAMACGAPVVALGRGGAAETVVGTGPDPTGVLFPEQSAAGLIDAIEQFERAAGHFNPEAGRARALAFSAARYEAGLFGCVDRVLAGGAATMAAPPGG